LERLLAVPNHAETIMDLNEDVLKQTRKRVKKAMKLRDYQAECARVFQDRTVTLLQKIQCEAKLYEIENQMRQSSDALRQAKEDYEHANNVLKQLKVKARQSNDALERLKARSTPELLPLFDEVVEETIPELEELLAQNQARVELASVVNPQVIIQYNERKAQIEAQQKKYQDKLAQVEALRQSMQQTRDSWITTLNGVVETISAYFSQAFDSYLV
jgi:chromosome segregation ATPase